MFKPSTEQSIKVKYDAYLSTYENMKKWNLCAKNQSKNCVGKYSWYFVLWLSSFKMFKMLISVGKPYETCNALKILQTMWSVCKKWFPWFPYVKPVISNCFCHMFTCIPVSWAPELLYHLLLLRAVWFAFEMHKRLLLKEKNQVW